MAKKYIYVGKVSALVTPVVRPLRVKMDWNDKTVEKVKVLWGEGLSASEIAQQIPGSSRNAIIGKVAREGFVRNDDVLEARERMRYSPRKTIVDKHLDEKLYGVSSVSKTREPFDDMKGESLMARKHYPNWVDNMPHDEIDVPEDKRVTVADLSANQCRWPIGDPQDPGFHFCHHTKVAGLPYCDAHQKRAFVPVRRRSLPSTFVNGKGKTLVDATKFPVVAE